MAGVLRCRALASTLAGVRSAVFETRILTFTSPNKGETASGTDRAYSSAAAFEPSASQSAASWIQRRWSSSTPSTSSPKPASPKGSGARQRQRRPQGKGQSGSGDANKKQEQSRRGPASSDRRPRPFRREGGGGGNRGDQEIRNNLLRSEWSLEARSTTDPDKMDRINVLEAIDPTAVLQSLNPDGLHLLRRLCTPQEWRRFASGELNRDEQSALLGRLAFALFSSPQTEARQEVRRVDLSTRPDFRIGDHLGLPPLTDEAPLPSALDVLNKQRDFFIQELGVSEEEYDAIKAEVAADFEETVRPKMVAAPAPSVVEAARDQLPTDADLAASVEDKLKVLDSNAFWGPDAKTTFARRLAKTLSTL